MTAWKDILREEIATGGSETSCPFCGIPRVRRSNYIRCCRCGINWLPGERLEKDPTIERLNLMVANTAKTATSSKEKKTQEERRGGR